MRLSYNSVCVTALKCILIRIIPQNILERKRDDGFSSNFQSNYTGYFSMNCFEKSKIHMMEYQNVSGEFMEYIFMSLPLPIKHLLLN